MHASALYLLPVAGHCFHTITPLTTCPKTEDNPFGENDHIRFVIFKTFEERENGV
jgi:hypothetical protein